MNFLLLEPTKTYKVVVRSILLEFFKFWEKLPAAQQLPEEAHGALPRRPCPRYPRAEPTSENHLAPPAHSPSVAQDIGDEIRGPSPVSPSALSTQYRGPAGFPLQQGLLMYLGDYARNPSMSVIEIFRQLT